MQKKPAWRAAGKVNRDSLADNTAADMPNIDLLQQNKRITSHTSEYFDAHRIYLGWRISMQRSR
jgi:hypothetical protein